MSRVHDALRKAAHEKVEAGRSAPGSSRQAISERTPDAAEQPGSVVTAALQSNGEQTPPPVLEHEQTTAIFGNAAVDLERLENVVRQAPTIPYTPAPDALLVNPTKPKEPPAEEFRSLRTRLNHLQDTQPLHTLVISSASPGEGKSFTACNLALSQAQLRGKRILLADFDFRRPSIDRVFGLKGTVGLTDYLLGKVRIDEIIHRVDGTNLFIITAGGEVQNPLELLNLPECGRLLDAFRDHFDWVILDSPPLLFAADGNLLATMADGTILVVRIGSTTYDSVTRAIQSLCENNVLGIVVNGAHHGELYSKYSYYHSYYYGAEGKTPETPIEESFDLEPAGVDKP